MTSFSKIIVTILLIVVILFAVVSLQRNRGEIVQESNRRLVASIYPLAFFAEQIGRDLVNVSLVTPTGAEPHDFEPSPQDLIKISNADIFIYNGSGIDPWAEQIGGIDNINVINLSEQLDLSGDDPHFWLDPLLAQRAAFHIQEVLIASDPDNEEIYLSRGSDLQEQLQKLDSTYQDGLTTCLLREIVVSHDAFNFLAGQYDFSVIALAGISPDEEPSPRKLSEIITEAMSRGITHIFFEPLVSSKLAETVARELGVEIMALNPIEGLTIEDEKTGQSYFSIMEQNLSSLKLAMRCD